MVAEAIRPLREEASSCKVCLEHAKDIIRKVEKFLRCKRKKRVIIWKAPQMPN
jgi:hypothetical protein